MELACQGAAFLFLDFEQPVRQGLELSGIGLQLLFRLFSLGDLLDSPEQAHHPSFLGVPDGMNGETNPADLTVTFNDADFADVALAGKEIRLLLDDPRHVGRVNEYRPAAALFQLLHG